MGGRRFQRQTTPASADNPVTPEKVELGRMLYFDPRFSTTGTGFFMKFPTYADNDYVGKYDLMKDKGRFEVTKKASDNYLFKVPTLRNIELTAPYFHNGSVKTLDQAVGVMAKTQLNKDLSDDEAAHLVAFLKGLTGEFPQQTLPCLPATSGWAILD